MLNVLVLTPIKVSIFGQRRLKCEGPHQTHEDEFPWVSLNVQFAL